MFLFVYVTVTFFNVQLIQKKETLHNALDPWNNGCLPAM